MFDENDELKDWEVEDENPHENLARKWVEREYFDKKTVDCPYCRKAVPSDSVSCLYCGAQIFQDSGLLGRIFKWIKSVF